MTDVKGDINIANDVLADMAGYAALECYGIVGMAVSIAPRTASHSCCRATSSARASSITSDGEGVTVDLYVVIEHGTNLSEVSHNLSERVEYVLDEDGRCEGRLGQRPRPGHQGPLLNARPESGHVRRPDLPPTRDRSGRGTQGRAPTRSTSSTCFPVPDGDTGHEHVSDHGRGHQRARRRLPPDAIGRDDLQDDHARLSHGRPWQLRRHLSARSSAACAMRSSRPTVFETDLVARALERSRRRSRSRPSASLSRAPCSPFLRTRRPTREAAVRRRRCRSTTLLDGTVRETFASVASHARPSPGPQGERRRRRRGVRTCDSRRGHARRLPRTCRRCRRDPIPEANRR